MSLWGVVCLILLGYIACKGVQSQQKKRAEEERKKEQLRRINNSSNTWASMASVLQSAPKTKTIGPPVRKRILVKKKREQLRSKQCPLCLDSIEDEPVKCSDCGTSFHKECVDEMNYSKCSTLGCGKVITNNMWAHGE